MSDLEKWLIEFDFLMGALLLGVILLCIVALMHPDPRFRAATCIGVIL